MQKFSLRPRENISEKERTTMKQDEREREIDRARWCTHSLLPTSSYTPPPDKQLCSNQINFKYSHLTPWHFAGSRVVGVSFASLALPLLCVFNSKADADNEKKTNRTQREGPGII